MTRSNSPAGWVAGIGLFWAMAALVQAQAPQERFQAGRPAESDSSTVLELPYSMRLVLDAASWPPAQGRASAVFTEDYRARALEVQAWHQARFGVHAVDALTAGPYLLRQTPVPGHPGLNLVEELRPPGARPLAGFQFERRDFLFKGDQLSVRSTSDLQTLAGGIGLSGYDTEAGMLSLLGWRSRSRLQWQWGEPTQELQWRFSAGLDRRAAAQSGTVRLQVLRRF